MRRHLPIQTAAASVHQAAQRHNAAAGGFDHLGTLASGFARGPNIFHDEDALARLDLELPAQSHSPLRIPLDEQSGHAERAGNFVSQDQTSKSQRNDDVDFDPRELSGEGSPEGFSLLRMRENEGALHVGRAMAAGRKDEMAVANRPEPFKELLDLILVHR